MEGWDFLRFGEWNTCCSGDGVEGWDLAAGVLVLEDAFLGGSGLFIKGIAAGRFADGGWGTVIVGVCWTERCVEERQQRGSIVREHGWCRWFARRCTSVERFKFFYRMLVYIARSWLITLLWEHGRHSLLRR